MSGSRLEILLDGENFAVPPGARIALLGPPGDLDISPLGAFDLFAVQEFRPHYDALAAKGLKVGVELTGEFDGAIVFVPRAKAAARHLIAMARQATSGPIAVDGQKTDGIEPIYKDLRKRADVSTAISKSHGKCFVVDGGDFAQWSADKPTTLSGGFITRAGVFSADAIDEGSTALADCLPAKLPKHVADLGAGWGYLSRRILERDGIEYLELVEANHTALECAKTNITDPRARFHWADALSFKPEKPLGGVIMNPPFHTGRKGEPGLGQAFIAAAADMLAPHGSLWIVANRHLPYEAEIEQRFRQHSEIGGDNRFKIIHAEKPRRSRR